MKRTAWTLCVLLAMTTLANGDCYKCVTRDGVVLFTDSPSQDATCEWLSNCSSTYSEELDRENQEKDAISRSQWEEAEARKTELKQQALNAKKLELQQQELELRQRELDVIADQARKEDNHTEGYAPVMRHGNRIKRNHDSRLPWPPESKMKHKELNSKARKDIKSKNKITGQPDRTATQKITNEKSNEEVLRITPTRSSPIVKQNK